MEKFDGEAQENQESKTNSVELSVSGSGLPAIEIDGASEEVRTLIRRIISANMADDPDYIARQKVGAFLQGDSENWMEIEFWKGSPEDHQEFVDYVNKRLNEGSEDFSN